MRRTHGQTGRRSSTASFHASIQGTTHEAPVLILRVGPASAKMADDARRNRYANVAPQRAPHPAHEHPVGQVPITPVKKKEEREKKNVCEDNMLQNSHKHCNCIESQMDM